METTIWSDTEVVYLFQCYVVELMFWKNSFCLKIITFKEKEKENNLLYDQ